MPDDQGALWHEAVALLSELPSQRDGVATARERVAQWRARHPGLRGDLLVHQRPGATRVEYDLLIGVPGHDFDTVAMTWVRSGDPPWAVDHADHWAANFVVTVNDTSTTVQEALLYLRTACGSCPDLMETIVEHHLLDDLVEESGTEVSNQELQEGADRFRRAQGLLSAADARAWLVETRLTALQFEELIEENVRREKAKQSLIDARIDAHFQQHRSRFDTLITYEVRARDGEVVELLAARAAHDDGLRGAAEQWLREATPAAGSECAICVSVASQRPSWIRDALVGELRGPLLDAGKWQLAEILSREPATSLAGGTRDAVAEDVFRHWIQDRRKLAHIQWHWM